ncbi:MAG: hypothetical protein Q4P78_02460 [Rothia sp. (in: high G+C Gram-positive bacteria)]|uniref:hypothetical protein n=1 Tax=Rothia sp. (in: high G+C Gram-positive bacteria) TaxID=1885016 RepID=UPI0026DF7F4E|nr:hypothetical protein [Rothia sp. (in: high G+C Gram-positive bacteria)]MDO5750050.1 hypothetical protein [Rothia sp. (in: high G+C Gram-positive bacteria)]
MTENIPQPSNIPPAQPAQAAQPGMSAPGTVPEPAAPASKKTLWYALGGGGIAIILLVIILAVSGVFAPKGPAGKYEVDMKQLAQQSGASESEINSDAVAQSYMRMDIKENNTCTLVAKLGSHRENSADCTWQKTDEHLYSFKIEGESDEIQARLSDDGKDFVLWAGDDSDDGPTGTSVTFKRV